LYFVFALHRLYRSSRARRALGTLGLEVRNLLQALASPTRIVDEVQQMRALQNEATRIEATQPARAAVLRHLAARIGR